MRNVSKTLTASIDALLASIDRLVGGNPAPARRKIVRRKPKRNAPRIEVKVVQRKKAATQGRARTEAEACGGEVGRADDEEP
jgi:hypothetical protein